jgi:acyl carrier protein
MTYNCHQFVIKRGQTTEVFAMNQITTLNGAETVLGGTEARVIAIIAAQAMLDETSITPDTPLADLGLDSLVMVEIVFALEEEFGVTIPFNANATSAADHASSGFDMRTPAQMAAALQALRAE